MIAVAALSPVMGMAAFELLLGDWLSDVGFDELLSGPAGVLGPSVLSVSPGFSGLLPGSSVPPGFSGLSPEPFELSPPLGPSGFTGLLGSTGSGGVMGSDGLVVGMRDQFATRAVRESVACIQNYIVSEYMAYRTIDIQLIPETFGLVLFGIVGMMKAKPDITDEELATLIAQTLRLDMTVMAPPPWPEHPEAPTFQTEAQMR